MEETTQTPSLFNHALKYGLILGIVGFVIAILTYVIDYTLLVTFKLLAVVIIVNIALVIYGGINYRNQIGGYLDYGKAFQIAYIMMIVAGIIGIIGNILLYYVIDTELPQKLTDAAVQNAIDMMRGFGMPEDKLDEQMSKIEADTANRFTIGGMLLGFIWVVVIDAVIAAILALFIRKRQPEVM